jgi:poly-gamma-glutamate synthesis protein (capsule biosynthesis protein)
MRALAVSTAAVLLLTSCSSSGDREEAPPPTVVRLHASEPLQERALSALTDLASPLNLTAEATGADQANLIISNEEAPGAVPFSTRYWVPAVGLPSARNNVTMNELQVALYSSEGGRPPGVIVPSDLPPPLSQWWPGATATVRRLAASEIAPTLEADPETIGLMPLGAVDASVRSLAVDGINIVFGEGNASTYPLIERGYVRAVPHENEAFTRNLEALAKQSAVRLAVAPPDPTILRATGDVLPVRCTLARIEELGGDFRRPFEQLGPWLAEADIAVSSLDAAVSDAGTPFTCQETFSLLAPSAAADGFEFAGIDVMTVATNHVKDCGTSPCGDQAFFDTLTSLRSRRIQPVGGGADLAEARAPAIVEASGITFAFLGYDQIASYYHASADAAGTAPLNDAFLREDVAAAAERAEVVVILPQWGVEYTADPNESQRTLARAAVQAGADLVIGNHPHWVQAAEVIDGSFVAYALGNFVFDQDWSLETQQGAVLEAAFHGPRLAGIRYYPVRIFDNHQPRFAEGAEAQQVLDRIWTASASLD